MIGCSMDLSKLATGNKIYSLRLVRRQQSTALKLSADQVHWPTRGALGKATGCSRKPSLIQSAASVAAIKGRFRASLCPPTCKERDSVRCYAKRSRAGSALDVDKTGNQPSPQSSDGPSSTASVDSLQRSASTTAAPSSAEPEPAVHSSSTRPSDEELLQEWQEVKKNLKEEPHKSSPQTDSPLDTIFVSSEVAPWSKTGGLGDVAGSLPIALASRGHRVMVVAPRYMHGTKADKLYDSTQLLDVKAQLDLGECGMQEVSFYHQHKNNVDFVFVDHPVYHRPGNPYADEHGAFGDNVFRYTLLSMAACEAPLVLPIGGYRSGQAQGLPYGEKCLFVANDWHAALVPSFLAAKYRRNGVYTGARSIVAIHNMSHQGVEPSSFFGRLGLPSDWWDVLEWKFPDWAAVTGPAINILKGAILAADRVMTVSQGYAWEITTSEGGWGLHEVLQSRQDKLNGIVNGIDMSEWDPANDADTEAAYSIDDLSGKAKCKAALQKELGFDVDPKIPLLGWIGRLDFQKGPDVVLQSVEPMAQRGCQIVMLGSGVPEYEQQMRRVEQERPDHFRGWVGFSIPVSHRIMAGCDILLMPSRFEPCGLNQLFAMRYGTIPIAHATGGLRDTIEDYNPFAQADKGESIGTGWTFTPPEVQPMMQALDLALQTYKEHPESWQKLMCSGMQQDLSWDRSAQQYEQIFQWAMMDPPVRPG